MHVIDALLRRKTACWAEKLLSVMALVLSCRWELRGAFAPALYERQGGSAGVERPPGQRLAVTRSGWLRFVVSHAPKGEAPSFFGFTRPWHPALYGGLGVMSP
jgi:hypothetical protein